MIREALMLTVGDLLRGLAAGGLIAALAALGVLVGRRGPEVQAPEPLAGKTRIGIDSPLRVTGGGSRGPG